MSMTSSTKRERMQRSGEEMQLWTDRVMFARESCIFFPLKTFSDVTAVFFFFCNVASNVGIRTNRAEQIYTLVRKCTVYLNSTHMYTRCTRDKWHLTKNEILRVWQLGNFELQTSCIVRNLWSPVVFCKSPKAASVQLIPQHSWITVS